MTDKIDPRWKEEAKKLLPCENTVGICLAERNGRKWHSDECAARYRAPVSQALQEAFDAGRGVVGRITLPDFQDY